MSRTCRFLRWLTPCFALAVLAAPGMAQPKRYVHFPIEPEILGDLKNRLANEEKLEPFKELIKKILADPKALDIRPDQVKDMKFEDAKFKEAIQKWLERDVKLQQSLREWIKVNQPDAQPQDVKKLQQDLKQLLDEAPPEGPPAIDSPTAVEPIKPKTDSFAKFAENAMKNMEYSQLGEWLRKSPAWTRAFEDMHGAFGERPEQPGFIEGLQGKLVPDGDTWQFAENALERLRETPRFRFDRLGRGLTVPGIGHIPLPDLGAPGASDLHGPSFSSIGQAAIWILAAMIALLILARFVRWPKRKKAVVEFQRPDLGPWPVRPETVSTRAELVKAFDYLALWTLGLRVQSWNHHAVASLWCEQTPTCADDASALANLYEQARYTDGVEPLSDKDRDVARQSLAKLAEAV